MNIENDIRAFVQENLAHDHRVAVVEFVDRLLAAVVEAGEISCCLAGDHGLSFRTPEEHWDVDVGLAKAKLRIICARLGVLCNESGCDVSLYGGEGLIKNTSLSVVTVGDHVAATSRESPLGSVANGNGSDLKTWAVRFKNTMHAQEFTIRAL